MDPARVEGCVDQFDWTLTSPLICYLVPGKFAGIDAVIEQYGLIKRSVTANEHYESHTSGLIDLARFAGIVGASCLQALFERDWVNNLGVHHMRPCPMTGPSVTVSLLDLVEKFTEDCDNFSALLWQKELGSACMRSAMMDAPP